MLAMFLISCDGAQVDSAGLTRERGGNEVRRTPSWREEAEDPGSVDPREEVAGSTAPKALEDRGDHRPGRDAQDQAQEAEPEEADDKSSPEADDEAQGKLPELHPGPDQHRLVQLLVAALPVQLTPPLLKAY
jgi:hypothetical protein